MAKLRSSQFTFRKNDTVGAEGAELDHLYLEDCFYDHGDLDIIRDCSNPSCIIVGRTGSGKTALIIKLQENEENIISIEPENLSLQYLSNSTILPQVEALGVNLGLFYKLLWRHIFAVELIKSKYSLRTEDQNRRWWETLWNIFSKDREKEKAIEYLRKWGEEFWKDTEYRVREVTSKLETNVKDTLGVKWPSILDASMSNEEKCSVEEKADVVKRLQEVVDSIQVRELTKVIKMLGDSVFEKSQPRFYVLLDKLDETWVADHFRYRLIKALIETVSDVNHHMKGVKVVVAIRRDLLNMVIQETRETGFQEEKYEPLYVNMKWTKEELFEMLNRRVNKLIRRQYTGANLLWSDVMPKTIAKKPTSDYLIERTMYRPRDLIVFFNICIQEATNKPEITAQMVLHAEAEYSNRRLRSLYDEWHAEYPELADCIGLLKKLPPQFQLIAIEGNAIVDLCLTLAASSTHSRGAISAWATAVIEQKMTSDGFRSRIASVFYRVGLVGLKIEATTAMNWSFLHVLTIPEAAIKDDCMTAICPIFYRTLGVAPPSVKQGNAP